MSSSIRVAAGTVRRKLTRHFVTFRRRAVDDLDVPLCQRLGAEPVGFSFGDCVFEPQRAIAFALCSLAAIRTNERDAKWMRAGLLSVPGDFDHDATCAEDLKRSC